MTRVSAIWATKLTFSRRATALSARAMTSLSRSNRSPPHHQSRPFWLPRQLHRRTSPIRKTATTSASAAAPRWSSRARSPTRQWDVRVTTEARRLVHWPRKMAVAVAEACRTRKQARKIDRKRCSSKKMATFFFSPKRSTWQWKRPRRPNPRTRSPRANQRPWPWYRIRHRGPKRQTIDTWLDSAIRTMRRQTRTNARTGKTLLRPSHSADVSSRNRGRDSSKRWVLPPNQPTLKGKNRVVTYRIFFSASRRSDNIEHPNTLRTTDLRTTWKSKSTNLSSRKSIIWTR